MTQNVYNQNKAIFISKNNSIVKVSGFYVTIFTKPENERNIRLKFELEIQCHGEEDEENPIVWLLLLLCQV